MQDATPHLAAPAGVLPSSASGATNRLIVWFAGGIFLTLSAIVLIAIMAMTGGRLIYSLDDPYIHLALSERLALGHYGINLGEVTSPSSSVIWPWLLAPGAGTSWHAAMPLLLNLGFGLATALLYGSFAAQLPLGPNAVAQRLVLAAALVLATNLVGLVFLGMEHNLQVLLAVLAALGVLEAGEDRPIPTWALVAAALGPAVRYEMFAITAAMLMVLLMRRDWRPATGLALASVVLPLAFSVFLMVAGNQPLPNSVITKLGAGHGGWQHLLLPPTWYQNINEKLIVWLMLATLVVLAVRSRGAFRWPLLAGALVAALHLIVGRFGWFYRYEMYAVAFCGLIWLWIMCRTSPILALFGPLIASSTIVGGILFTPTAAHNIYEQQYQMHRFVRDHYKRAFAVNDLGWVSYQLDPKIYVLDLWGLASNEAARTRNKSADWLDDVTVRHRAGLAMIQAKAFASIPRSWQKVGELRLSRQRITSASDRVALFATRVGDAQAIRDHLRAFKSKLPAGVKLEIIDH